MPGTHILVISATLGYRHDSIPTSIAVLKQLASSNPSLIFEFTEEPKPYFASLSSLSTYNAILFLSSTGPILDDAEIKVLAQYTQDPQKAIVGIHAATVTCQDSPSFNTIFGASFDYHPDIQTASVHRTSFGVSHPTTASFPDQVSIFDEWYNFTADPVKAGNRVLLTVDEGTYKEDEEKEKDRLMLEPHPVAWCRGAVGEGEGEEKNREGPRGRTWYTSLGHTHEIWGDKMFVDHVLAGIKWATRM